MILQWQRTACALLGWAGAAFLLAASTQGMAVASATTQASALLRADGSRFALTLPNGKVLYSQDLVGATLRMQDGTPMRIDHVQGVPDPHGQTLWQHTLSTPDAQGNWRSVCTPHQDGSSVAMVVPGRERGDGTVDEDPQTFTIACTSGAQGKCLRFGYRPWQTLPNGTSQRAAYNACIRMVRADYGGTGQGYTENGKSIDVYDDAHIQTPDRQAGQDFEAGWGPTGAVCVRHVRVAKNVTLKQLEDRFPALKGRVGTVCTEDFARRHGALVFNRSDPLGALPSTLTP